MTVIAVAPGVTRGAPARAVAALVSVVALAAVSLTFSAGVVTGRSLTTTPLPGPTTGSSIASATAPTVGGATAPRPGPSVRLPAPRPLPSAPHP